MKISDYMPKLYKKNVEMNNIIDSEEIEMELLKTKIDTSFNNSFYTRADIEGITQFEQIFDIIGGVDISLETRRQRIRNKLNAIPPFTEAYMVNYINNLIGEENWNYELDYNNYSLSIEVVTPGDYWYNELVQFLIDTIPINLQLSIQKYEASWDYVRQSFATWNDITEMTWQDILDGEY